MTSRTSSNPGTRTDLDAIRERADLAKETWQHVPFGKNGWMQDYSRDVPALLDECTRARELLAQLAEQEPWVRRVDLTYDTCGLCDEARPHHFPECEIPRARAFLAPSEPDKE